MLPESMRNQIEDQARQWLKDTCSLYRSEYVINEFGESVQSTVQVASGIPCRVTQSNSTRVQIATVGRQERIISTYRLTIPLKSPTYNFDLAVNQQVMLSNGKRYEIIQIEDALTDAVWRQADIAEVV